MQKIRLIVAVVVGALCGAALWHALYVQRQGSHASLMGGARFSADAIDKIVVQGNKIVPIAVIGSGPAGRSAALYASRLNFHVVCFEGKEPGGQLMGTSEVENWPGIKRDLGPQIMERLKYQASEFGALFATTSVVRVDNTQWPFLLELEDGEKIYALSVIIATGSTPKRLSIPGEQEYWGKGVATCAVCDAAFHANEAVIVVGGGDAAVEETLQLAAYARSITVLVRGDHMRASHAMQDRLRAYPQVSIKYHTQLKEIMGDSKHVTGVKIISPEGESEMPIHGVFLAIGHTPNSKIVEHIVQCNKLGYIERPLPHRQATSEPGIFVAGDVADHLYRQAGVASGNGIMSALDAVEFLRNCHLGDAELARFEKYFYDPTTVESSHELTEVTSVKQFEKEVLASSQAVVIEFYTPTCPTCQQVGPLLASVLQQYEGVVQGFKVDGSVLPELMERYEVTSVPTMLILKKGIVMGRTKPVLSRREIRSYIALFI